MSHCLSPIGWFFMTFLGSTNKVGDAGEYGSLADGNYLLTIDLEKDGFGNGSDHQFGAEEVDSFFRFFGDCDGDRDVDNLDYFQLRGTYRQNIGSSRYLWYLDYDGDSNVDYYDVVQFQARYHRVLAWTP